MSETPEVFSYAKFEQRLFANAIDVVVLLLAWQALTSLIPAAGRAWFFVWALSMCLPTACNIVLHTMYGQTPGKMLMKIYVRLPSGQPIAWRNAVLRSSVELLLDAAHLGIVAVAWRDGVIHLPLTMDTLAAAIATLPLVSSIKIFVEVWFWSEVVTMLLNKKRRALHDFLGGTVVLRRVK